MKGQDACNLVQIAPPINTKFICTHMPMLTYAHKYMVSQMLIGESR